MRVKFTVPGRPVPAQRMTQKSKWSKRARKSLDYQEQVGWEWKAVVGKVRLEGDLAASINFFFDDNRHGDIDNLIKSVVDGLQYANAFDNDKQVKKVSAEIFYDEEERAEVEIKELEE